MKKLFILLPLMFSIISCAKQSDYIMILKSELTCSDPLPVLEISPYLNRDLITVKECTYDLYEHIKSEEYNEYRLKSIREDMKILQNLEQKANETNN